MIIIKNTLVVVLLFMLIFGFRLPIIYNSAVFVFLISIVVIFFHQPSFSILQKLAKRRYVLRILLLFILIYVISLLISIFHGTYDITMSNKFIGLFATVIISLFVYSSIYISLKDKNDLIKFIILVFVVQSFIQIISLLSPEFLSIIRQFQDARSSEIGTSDYYHGIRALSLSTELFFGLSGAYGLVLIFFMKYMLDTSSFNNKNIFLFFIISTSMFFVGRTVAIGLAFALLYFVFYKGHIFKLRIMIKIIVFLALALVIIFNMLSTNLQFLITDTVLPTVFDFSSSGQGPRSLHTLNNMLSFEISEKTILLGDGFYTTNGSYYMTIDSGYYRQILFGGIIYLLLNFIYFIIYFAYGKYLIFSSKNDLIF